MGEKICKCPIPKYLSTGYLGSGYPAKDVLCLYHLDLKVIWYWLTYLIPYLLGSDYQFLDEQWVDIEIAGYPVNWDKTGFFLYRTENWLYFVYIWIVRTTSWSRAWFIIDTWLWYFPVVNARFFTQSMKSYVSQLLYIVYVQQFIYQFLSYILCILFFFILICLTTFARKWRNK